MQMGTVLQPKNKNASQSLASRPATVVCGILSSSLELKDPNRACAQLGAATSYVCTMQRMQQLHVAGITCITISTSYSRHALCTSRSSLHTRICAQGLCRRRPCMRPPASTFTRHIRPWYTVHLGGRPQLNSLMLHMQITYAPTYYLVRLTQSVPETVLTAHYKRKCIMGLYQTRL